MPGLLDKQNADHHHNHKFYDVVLCVFAMAKVHEMKQENHMHSQKNGQRSCKTFYEHITRIVTRFQASICYH